MNWVVILQENMGHFHYMQSSKKAVKGVTPLILNRIPPKCHPETRAWGYFKSEGIKSSNFHLYKGVEGHDSCHTRTINWVKLDFPIWVRITKPCPGLLGGEVSGLLSSSWVHVHTYTQLQDMQSLWCNWLVVNKYVCCSERKNKCQFLASHFISLSLFPHL